MGVSSVTGRPSTYTPEIAAEICRRLGGGESLLAICRDEAMPSDVTVRRWALEDVHGFSAQYARAREVQAHAVAEMAVADAETARDPQLGRLAYDARKWFAGKLLPKVYGDKTLHAGSDGDGPVKTETKVTVEIVRPASGGEGGV